MINQFCRLLLKKGVCPGILKERVGSNIKKWGEIKIKEG